MTVLYATHEQQVLVLTAWLRRRAERGRVVTADELVARIKTNWPTTSSDEIDRLYQAVGHL